MLELGAQKVTTRVRQVSTVPEQVTAQFVFLHVYRTGQPLQDDTGMWVSRVGLQHLLTCQGAWWRREGHVPARDEFVMCRKQGHTQGYQQAASPQTRLFDVAHLCLHACKQHRGKLRNNDDNYDSDDDGGGGDGDCHFYISDKFTVEKTFAK